MLERLEAVVGAAHLSTTPPDRVAYARDLWPRTQLDRLIGLPPQRPTAVVWPGSTEEVAELVRICAETGTCIVPFGAGSGVCGATLPHRGGIVVDLKRLKRIRSVDAEAGLLEVEAGMIGERLERKLEHMGLTLGHFPSSILCSTVGGWLAGRSAGQCSSRYGKIEDMVIDMEVVTGEGRIRRTRRRGDPGAGVDFNQIFVGSEGTLGIITAATLRVHPQPAHRCFRGYLVPSIRGGLEVMRRTMQAGHRPAVLRLYDPVDTLMVGSDPEAKHKGGGGLLKSVLDGKTFKQKGMRLVLGKAAWANRLIRALPERSLLVTMSEGEQAEAEECDALMRRFAAEQGAEDLGEAPGRSWLAHRYDVSYKQSALYENGNFVDTCEVATTWARVPALYEAVRRAVAEHVLVMAHFSHAYPGGCSIYFTFAGTGDGPAEMKARYDAAWRGALDTAVSEGATIAHHHGAGLSRASHMPAEHGEARRWFAAFKSTLDPAGILNPGKLFAESP